jgi:hypothetical protein
MLNVKTLRLRSESPNSSWCVLSNVKIHESLVILISTPSTRHQIWWRPAATQLGPIRPLFNPNTGPDRSLSSPYAKRQNLICAVTLPFPFGPPFFPIFSLFRNLQISLCRTVETRMAITQLGDICQVLGRQSQLIFRLPLFWKSTRQLTKQRQEDGVDLRFLGFWCRGSRVKETIRNGTEVSRSDLGTSSSRFWRVMDQFAIVSSTDLPSDHQLPLSSLVAPHVLKEIWLPLFSTAPPRPCKSTSPHLLLLHRPWF